MDILFYIISFLIGMFVMYLTTYTKEKGKNKALLEDNAKLENEKQKVIASYQGQLENEKKLHALDIQKRTYLYEDKRTQFTKYYNILDSFNVKTSKLIADRFSVLMPNFLEAMGGSLEEQNKGIITLNSGVQNLFNELYNEFKIVKLESNSIKLISSSEVDTLLDNIDKELEATILQTEDMLRFMATPEFIADQSLGVPYQTRVSETGKKVEILRDELKLQMKKELAEI